jgi:hypothetical protein
VKYADALGRISELHDTATSRLLPFFVPYAALSVWLTRKDRSTRLQNFNGVIKEVET